MIQRQTFPLRTLRRLEGAHNSKVVAYVAASSRQGGKLLGAEDVLPLYECITGFKSKERTELFVHTEGGELSAAHRIAMLFRERCGRFTLLVPHRARSAGTLLALGASRIVLGTLSELSPIDANISRSTPTATGEQPAIISSEEVRAFSKLAKEWFGVRSPEGAISTFELISQRFFPTALATFYTSDRYVRKLADELLRFSIPNISVRQRKVIVDRLVGEYVHHSHAITRSQAKAIGLNVAYASSEEEELQRLLLEQSVSALLATENRRGALKVGALIFSSRCGFAYVCSDAQSAMRRSPASATAKAGWRRVF